MTEDSRVGEKLTFEQKMENRIKESIGDLMSDEDLKPIVAKAVEKVFFQPTKEVYGWHEKVHPSWLEQTVRELLREQMREAVQAEIASRRDELQAVVHQALSQDAGTLILQQITSLFAVPLQQAIQVSQAEVDRIRERLNAAGGVNGVML